MLDCKIKFYFSEFILFKLLFSWVTFICAVFLHIIMLQKCEFGYFWRHNLRYIDQFCCFQTLTKFESRLNLRSIPEVHISLQLLAAPQSGADAGAGLWNCGKGGMREEVNEGESARQAGQEGAQDISTGRVKKLQGWRSDQTGLRRWRGRP